MKNIYNEKTKFDLRKGFTQLLNGKSKCIISSGFLLSKFIKT